MRAIVTRPAKTLLGLILFIAAIFPAAVSMGGSRSGIAPYDPALYETGYRVFLMNGNIADALALAEAAIAARPGDAIWRKRAARCADWGGKPELALTGWAWLALNTDDGEAGDRAMKLARGLNDIHTERLLLGRRLERHADTETLKSYVRTCERLGEPDAAIRFLEAMKAGELRVYALAQLSRLYEEIGSPGHAVGLLREYSAENPADVRSLLHLANLQYGTGDIRGAYETLKGAINSGAADDREFLVSLSDICWIMQDVDCSATASRKLAENGQVREEDYRRLIYSLRQNNRPEAFLVAKTAWKQFGKPWFFADIAEFGESLGKWEELDGIIAGMEKDRRAALERDFNFWLLRSRVSAHLGRPDEAIAAYREALRLNPAGEEIASGFIWLLLDLKKNAELKRIVFEWRQKGAEAPEIVDALASACAYLGYNREALVLYRKRYREKKDDPLWLSAYADTLEQNNRADEAFSERVRSLRIIRGAPGGKAVSPSAEKDLEATLAGLMMGVEKGDRLDSLMDRIIRGANDDVRRELAAAWALSSERSDFARWWLLKAYARNRMDPAWVRLGLALEENDRYGVSGLIEKVPDRLPYRDAVEGARVTGDLPLAEETAWNSSDRNPDDQKLDSQLRELFQAHRSFAGYGLRLLDRGGIGGIENGVEVSAPLNRRFTLFSNFSHTLNSALKGGVIANLPSVDLKGTAGVTGRFEKGVAGLSLGWRSAVEDFPMLEGTLSYRISGSISAGAELEYSRPADESVPLIIGGARDRVALNISWTPSARDTIQGGFAQAWLRDQSRNLLGEEQSYTLDIYHKLFFEYPDISVRAFGGYHGFERNGAPQGRTLSLVPEGAPADASFFVPGSYGQIGAGVSLGQGFRDDYSRNWKPFGATDISWKSDTGVAYNFELGVHGPVFGYDSLSFGLLVESGTFATSDLSVVLGVGYRYLFN